MSVFSGQDQLSNIPHQLLNARVDKKTALQISIECENKTAIEALVRSGAALSHRTESSENNMRHPVLRVFSKLQELILMKETLNDANQDEKSYQIEQIIKEITNFIHLESPPCTALTQHKLCYQFTSALIDCSFIQVSSNTIESILNKIPIDSPLYTQACAQLAHVLLTHKSEESKDGLEYKEDSNVHKAIWYALQSKDPDMMGFSNRLLCNMFNRKYNNRDHTSPRTSFTNILRGFEAPEVAEASTNKKLNI